ncbi:MAG TPA: oligopeptide/dipeptide ABC transporter ATP-binding protein [Nitrososphaerales archaeon]|nr:oligopeptide/dipeptide ABC transporter ATP-binding protein [Nitrososphaerales archaeon]
MTGPLLIIKDVKKHFPVKRSFVEGLLGSKAKSVRAVDGVTLSIQEGEVFVLVGESGSGKTTLGKLSLRVYSPTSGAISFGAQAIAGLKGQSLKEFRRSAQMVYQDPVAALNPRVRIGDAIAEPLRFHRLGTPAEQKEKVIRMMRRVGFDPPEEFHRRFSHELSGGQRQRVVIARALILGPRFVVADEPVAMLDVSIRAQILKLLLDLKREMNLTLLIITHDIAIAKYFADHVAIMYLGQIVEHATREVVFRNPMHPYTKALFSAVPIPDPERSKERLLIQGEIPSSINPPKACRFNPRCPFAFDRCRVDEPRLVEREPGHFVSCHLYDK